MPAASKVGLLPAGTKARTTPAAATRSKAVALRRVWQQPRQPSFRCSGCSGGRWRYHCARRTRTQKGRQLCSGDLVDHKVFGRGKVLKVTPVAGDCIVEIQFDRVGIKKTMANYAPLTKLTSEE